MLYFRRCDRIVIFGVFSTAFEEPPRPVKTAVSVYFPGRVAVRLLRRAQRRNNPVATAAAATAKTTITVNAVQSKIGVFNWSTKFWAP